MCRRFTAYVTEYKLMSPENLNVPMTGMNSNNGQQGEDGVEDDVADDNEVDEESMIMVAEDPDNESSV